MDSGKKVFTQLMYFIPKYALDKLVAKYNGN